MKIAFLDSHTLSLNGDVDFSVLRSLGNYTGYALTNKDNIIPYCKKADIVIVNKIIISENSIKKLPNLKLIAVIATGYNNIDIEAAKENNIKVTNVPDYAANSVSQHVFSLILNLTTKAYLYNEDVKKGEWSKSSNFGLLKYPTFELNGKIIGIIGFGAIGRAVASIASGFGMKVIVNDIKDISNTDCKKCSIEYILKNADIVSIHCPLNSQTKNMIDAAAIKKMKRSAILINTSRGGIVNEAELAQALTSGEIAGAGIDVLSEEPPQNSNPLLQNIKNLIITPHTAWSTFEARQRMIDITAENIRAFLNGKNYNLVF